MYEDFLREDMLEAIVFGRVGDLETLIAEAKRMEFDATKIRVSVPSKSTPKQDVWSMLMVAIMKSTEMVRCFLDNGADVEFGTVGGFTPLHYLATVDMMFSRTHPYVFENARALIEAGANVDATENLQRRTPLFYAMRNPDMVKFLIESGCDVHYRTGRPGMTMLMVAARSGHPDSIRLLIREGVGLDLQDEDGWTAVDHARFTENVETTRIIERAIWHRDIRLTFASGNHERIGSESLVRSLDQGVIDEILEGFDLLVENEIHI
jgi:ankyrin repeat protein